MQRCILKCSRYTEFRPFDQADIVERKMSPLLGQGQAAQKSVPAVVLTIEAVI
jgi:hypothetical protein